MQTQTIDGQLYGRMLTGGANMLAAHAAEINDLNVFPVADGDTGTNMSMTMEGGLAEIATSEGERIGDLSARFSRGILFAARGNSGVILSQIFAGINEGLSSYGQVNAHQLAEAYKRGIEKSYAAVQNPTEGTILTVFRESVDYAASRLTENSTVEDFFRSHVEEARRSLERTKELLPVLAEADVIDSGAAGYLCIAEGMYGVLSGKEPAARAEAARREQNAPNIDLFGRDSVLEFGYCTEFLLRLTTAKCDPDAFDVSLLVGRLEALGGESIVAYKQEDIVKVHVHTFAPGAVLAAAQEYGEFLTVKIENMSLGHSGTKAPKKKGNGKKFSVLAVATGDGLSALFGDMGVDRIVAGGQTSNPSIEELVAGFDACAAEDIIVLPNNKNIILAAKQAAELYNKARVHVVETKNIAQGYAALSVITPGITDINALLESATRAAAGVTSIEVTQAVRDANVEGRSVKAGDYMAITDGGMSALAPTAEDAVMLALDEADTDLAEIITLFTGKGVTAERRVALTERLEESYPDCEITVYEGGQDVYDYLIAME
ncbi:MAG: DAK2 domain-containing protein [Clostridia bacterium]|nr:DAK2 domain-containing protein [Clostridia bacterium]